MSLDGRVEKKKYVVAEVYDLENTNGPRGRAEASCVRIELHPDRDGVIVKVGAKRYLVSDAVLDAASEVSG